MATLALNFSGPIGHPATTKLRNGICGAVNELLLHANGQPAGKKYDSLILMMNSDGGSLEDGLSLYGLLKSVPLKITTVNMGLVGSIAIVPFLAGEHRICCPHGSFHFHNFNWNYLSPHTMTREQFTDHTQLLDIARSRTLEILENETLLTDADFKTLKLLDYPVVEGASFAEKKGIIQEIGFPALPEGTTILNVDY